MGLETIALGAAAAGSLWNAYSSNKSSNAQNKRQTQLFNTLTPQMQTGPSDIESLLMSSFQGRGTPNVNIGQDAILQSMRTNPYDKVLQSNLAGMLGNGPENLYDHSALFDSIEQRGNRDLGVQLDNMRAGVSGLGQRFGGAQAFNEQELRRKFLEDTMLREQGIGLQSFTDAQNRRLQAASGLTAFGNLQLGRDTGALSGLNSLAGLGIQADQGTLQWLNTILQGQGQRNNYNLGIAQTAAGLPFSPGGQGGTAVADIGQLLFLKSLMDKKA